MYLIQNVDLELKVKDVDDFDATVRNNSLYNVLRYVGTQHTATV